MPTGSLSAIRAGHLRSGTLLLSRALCSSSLARAVVEPAGGHFRQVPVHDASKDHPATRRDDKPTKEDKMDGAKAGATAGAIYGLILGFLVEPSLEGAAVGSVLGTLGGAAFGAVRMAPYAAQYHKDLAEGHAQPPKKKAPPKSDTTYWA